MKDCCCCKCHPAAVETWDGNRTFSEVDRDLTDDLPAWMFSQYDNSLVWRIRYNENEAFVRWLTLNQVLRISHSEPRWLLDGGVWMAGGSGASGFLLNHNATAYMGPVRDGRIAGMDPEGEFVGAFTLTQLGGNELEDVALPWILEVGCYRCLCLGSGGAGGLVRYPRHKHYFWDPNDLEGSPGLNPYILKAGLDPNTHPIQVETINGSEQPTVAATNPGHEIIRSVYWGGDRGEPKQPSDCVSNVIVWIQTAGGGFHYPYTGRILYQIDSLPALPIDHPALIAAPGPATLWGGWSDDGLGPDDIRKPYEMTFADSDTGKADGLYLAHWQPHAEPSDETLGLIGDWLEEKAERTVVLDMPDFAAHERTQTYLTHTAFDHYQNALASANNTLAGIGSAMRVAEFGEAYYETIVPGELTGWAYPQSIDGSFRFVAVEGNSLGLSGTLNTLTLNGMYGQGNRYVRKRIYKLVPGNAEVVANFEAIDDEGNVLETHPFIGIEDFNGSRLVVAGATIEGSPIDNNNLHVTKLGFSKLSLAGFLSALFD